MAIGGSGQDEASVDEDATIVHGYSADALMFSSCL